MAQIREIRLIDDLDGGDADETLTFGVDGKSYEIDLSKDNAGQLRDGLAAYVAAARRTGGRQHTTPSPSTGRRAPIDREQNIAIRDWARKRNMKVSDRGRISTEILQAYHRESPTPAPAEVAG